MLSTRASRGAAIVIVGAIAAALVIGLGDGGGVRGGGGRSSIVGTRVSGFTLENIAGGMSEAPWSSYHATVLLFFASWCPPCHVELPALASYVSSHGHRGVAIMGVDSDVSAGAASGFVAHAGVTFPVVLDPNESVGPALFGFAGYPDAAMVSSSGVVLAVHTGALPVRTLARWIAKASTK